MGIFQQPLKEVQTHLAWLKGVAETHGSPMGSWTLMWTKHRMGIELLDVPKAEKKSNVLRRAFIKRVLDGFAYHGFV